MKSLIYGHSQMQGAAKVTIAPLKLDLAVVVVYFLITINFADFHMNNQYYNLWISSLHPSRDAQLSENSILYISLWDEVVV